VSIIGSSLNASSARRPFFSLLRCVCPRLPWLVLGTGLVLTGRRAGVLLATVWVTTEAPARGAVEVLNKEGCLLEEEEEDA
jgi:hypothetical protein